MNSLEAFEFTGIFFLYTIPNTVKKKNLKLLLYYLKLNVKLFLQK